MVNSVFNHVSKKIISSKVNDEIDGYPYIEINDLFPEDYYKELIDVLKNMNQDVFNALSKNYPNRYIYDLNQGEKGQKNRQNFNDLKPQERKFWLNFQQTFLIDESFKNLFFSKYEDYIDFPYLNKSVATCRLQRDFKNYSIGPHRDRLDKLFSVMIYTPTVDILTDKIKKDHGTEICILNHEDPKNAPLSPKHIGTGADRHFSFDDVRIIKTALSEPNSLFSWAVAARSFHGVTPLKVDKIRSTIAYFVKIPKNLTGAHKLYGNSNFKKVIQ